MQSPLSAAASFAEEFRENGPADGEGVIVTQVVPPFMSNATGVLEYRRLLQKYYPEYEPGFVSLEGFIAATIFTEGLRLAGPDLNTETLIDALHRINDLDIGIGPMLTFSPSRHTRHHIKSGELASPRMGSFNHSIWNRSTASRRVFSSSTTWDL